MRRVRGARVAYLEDATFVLQWRCNDRPGTIAEVEGAPTLRLGAAGHFSYRHTFRSSLVDSLDTFSGVVRADGRASVQIRHEQSGKTMQGTAETCDSGTVPLTLAPTPRVAVADGNYHGGTANNEAIELHVANGGRLINPQRVPPPLGLLPDFVIGTWQHACTPSSCTWSPTTQDSCADQETVVRFVQADGSFTVLGLDGVDATGQFAPGGAVTGRLDYAQQPSCSATWSAHRSP